MQRIDRRTAVQALALAAGSGLLERCGLLEQVSHAAEPDTIKLATFRADVTPPVGHPLLGSLLQPATGVDDPLSINGLVLLGAGEPIVLAAIDWCEVRNDAYRRWVKALAEAAGTTPDRVLFSSVHQHDAPLADLTAQRLAEEHKLDLKLIQPAFFNRCVRQTAQIVRECLPAAKTVTHLGLGQAKVVDAASSRRVVDSDGKVSFARYSQTPDLVLRALPEGRIDPWLKTISFWNDDEPLVAISAFATHPMSNYGGGRISSDFVGLARARRQKDLPGVAQIYCSGCSGDVTAGKYNDGTSGHRTGLTDRLYAAMVEAWKATERRPLAKIKLRAVPLLLPHRNEAGFAVEDLERQLRDSELRPFDRVLAALGLSSRASDAAGHKMVVQALDFGGAAIVLLPGESFVAYQLLAQQFAADKFVMAIGYGECSPGYIPTEQDFREGFTRESHSTWTWVTPQAEKLIAAALKAALKAD